MLLVVIEKIKNVVFVIVINILSVTFIKKVNSHLLPVWVVTSHCILYVKLRNELWKQYESSTINADNSIYVQSHIYSGVCSLSWVKLYAIAEL